MHTITLKHILKIIQDSLSTLDSRLVGHGNQVAYIFWKMLDYTNKYTHQDLLQFSSLGVFHDIGAYKTEELNDILKFEVASPHNHSIYGHLFIKYFSPLSEKADTILYHHLDYLSKDQVVSEYIDEALLLHLADRIAIMLQNNKQIDYTCFSRVAGVKFSPRHIDLFIEANKKLEITKKVLDGSYLEELHAFFDTQNLTYEELLAYSRMFAYSIDFRSEYTVYHTIVVAELSRLLCIGFELDEATTNNVIFAATMHDIGKISTPVDILEKPGKLTVEEMKIMKKHVEITCSTLQSLGLKEITEIASYHHEKLDGSGYPFGLKADQLSFPVRIVMVADILSALLGKRSYKEPFSKEKIIYLLNDIAAHGKIDTEIVAFIVLHYDSLTTSLDANCKDAILQYQNIKSEYAMLTHAFNAHYDHISC